VIERTRLQTELDSLRWYDPVNGNIIHEDQFYCYDLGTQLKPLIENFFKTSEYKNKIEPVKNRRTVTELDWDHVSYKQPFSLQSKIENKFHSSTLTNTTTSSFSASKIKNPIWIHSSEFEVFLAMASDDVNISTVLSKTVGEIFLWQLQNSSTVALSSSTSETYDFINLNEGDICLLSDSNTSVPISIIQKPSNSALLIITNKTIKSI
jgi:hypothetical protein